MSADDEGPSLEGESVELLRTLIRNACVNDGTEASGQEHRNAEVLGSLLEATGADLERYEPVPGRVSLVASVEPPRPDAEVLVYLAHTDVVPVSPDGWSRDPFEAEVVDGEVWGRGAVDMLNLTSTMAVAFRRLLAKGRPPCGLVYAAVADEEAGGGLGAKWLVEHVPLLRSATGVVSEFGGMPMRTPSGRTKLPIVVAEKGVNWTRLVVHGHPGHGSQPYGADNALHKAALVVQRLAEASPEIRIVPVWEAYVRGLGLDRELTEALVDPSRVDDALRRLPKGLAVQAHASTRTTFTPTVAHGGTKTNVIPDRVELEVDIRILPGEDPAEVPARLRAILGDLAGSVDIDQRHRDAGTESPTGTPLWHALARTAAQIVPGSELVPFLVAGGTDSRYFRLLGVPAYGFGLFSERVPLEDFQAMFHGNDERVDTESLRRSAQLFAELPHQLAAIAS
jgi:acetylornithine deacetylase/succinyl-diaminopimelate desuccinylase-like protein